jgi:hypothetical protein
MKMLHWLKKKNDDEVGLSSGRRQGNNDRHQHRL